MNNWYNYMVSERMRRAEEIEAARHYRLEKEALAAQRHSQSSTGVGVVIRRWIYTLGGRLVAWGCWLQTRYNRSLAQTFAEDSPTPCT